MAKIKNSENGMTTQPKRLSKAGEWLRANPKGLGVTINDMRAVMR